MIIFTSFTITLATANLILTIFLNVLYTYVVRCNLLFYFITKHPILVFAYLKNISIRCSIEIYSILLDANPEILLLNNYFCYRSRHKGFLPSTRSSIYSKLNLWDYVTTICKLSMKWWILWNHVLKFKFQNYFRDNTICSWMFIIFLI